MFHISYNLRLKDFSRKLRNHSTTGEVLLWQVLRAGNMMNYKFNRQKPLDKYIVDFYCRQLNLVIEVDGPYHFEDEQKIKDAERENILRSLGLNFLRFHDEEVRTDIDYVKREIENFIRAFETSKRTNCTP